MQENILERKIGVRREKGRLKEGMACGLKNA
jgi:hypothetical protein